MGFLAAIMPWRWLICGGMFVLSLGCEEFRVGLLRHEYSELAVVLQKERTEAAEQRAAAEKAAREAEDKYRAEEAKWTKQLEDARNARIHDEMVNNHRIADLQRERGQLLDSIKTFASGGDASDDSVTAARSRADALGALLTEALQTAAELAEDAEREAGDARQLRQSWPQGE